MNKQEFLAQLRKKLSGLPRAETEEKLTFYSEMIDDRIEEGLTEEEAVAQIGSAEDLLPDAPTPTRRKLSGVEILLLVLGAPIWLSLLIALVSIVLSVYAALWSVVISLWAAFGSAIACAVGFAVSGGIMSATGNTLPGVASIGLGLAGTGLSIFLHYLAQAATKGLIWLTKKIFHLIFTRKGAA